MKTTNILFLLFVCLFKFQSSLAQITEGKMIAKQAMSSPDTSMQDLLSSFSEQTITNYFKDGKVRMELFGAYSGNTSIIYDTHLQKGIMLRDDPSEGKLYWLIDSNSTKSSKQDINKYKTNETDTIAGYICQKYIIKSSIDSTQKVIIWVANDLHVFSDMIYSSQFIGTVLKWETRQNISGFNKPITIVYEVMEIIDTKVSDEMFDMTIPDGYTKQTME